jgi:choline kinase
MTRAIILNSGTGSRMGSHTAELPKCLVALGDGDTILSRQLKYLEQVGVSDVLITTGPFEEKIVDYLDSRHEGVEVNYVNNPRYQETNRDIILMHGDLVFDLSVMKTLLDSDFSNAVLINPHVALPEKDFKAEVSDGLIRKVAVDIFGPDCAFLLPIYKLTRQTMDRWMDEIALFERRGELSVYAENALNKLLPDLPIHAVELKDQFCMEIDDADDLEVARRYLQEKGH